MDPSMERYPSNEREIDVNYDDPIGPAPERPKTSSRKKDAADDDFGDEELGDDLLPV
jgi:intraflagellar transport protein 88